MKPKLGLQEGSAAQLVSARAAGLQSPVHSRKKKTSGVWTQLRDSSLRFLFKFYKAHQTLPESYTYILLLLNLLQAAFPNSGVCKLLVVHPDNQVWIFDTVVVLTAFLGGIGAWFSQVRLEKGRKRAVADSQVDLVTGQADYSSWVMLTLAYLVQFVVINIAARSVSTCLLSLTMPSQYQNNSKWTVAGLAEVYLGASLRAFQLFLQVLTSAVSLLIITLYVVFIENPIPRMSLLSASNGLNSLQVVLTPGLCLLFGVIGKLSLNGLQISLQSNNSNATFLVLLIARSLPTMLAVLNILTTVVFYNKQAGLAFAFYHLLVYFLSIFDFLQIVLGAHQDLLKVYSLLASFLFILCIALIRNMLEAKRLAAFKSDDFEIVNRVVQECFPGNPAYGTQNQDLNVTMYMNYVAPGINTIVKSFLEQEQKDGRTFRSPPEILLMSLFDELLKCKIDNGFTACVVYIYYLTNINFSLSRVLLLHSLLRMSVAGISQQFLLMIVEEMISSRIDHCMRRGDMIIHERLAISQCAKDSSGLKKTNKSQGFRDDGLGQMSGSVWMFPQQNNGESNSSLRFQRRNKDNLSGVFQTEKSRLSMKGLHMYQTYELMLEAVQTQLGKVLEFYETLSAPDMNIYQLHQNSEVMCANSGPPKLLFAALEQECLGECSFHLIPYGLYIHLAENNSQIMRENLRKYATRSKSLLKRVTSKLWHWQCKASEVILETSLEPAKRGEILYTSRIPRWFCRHPHAKEYVLRQNVNALFPDDLARYHSLLVNQYLERFDREYFGKESDRYIRGFGADNFMRVAVNTTISTSLSRGVSAITLIVPSRQEDYFLVFQDGKTLIGISESLARLDPGIVENVRKKELTEISAELPAYLEQVLQSQGQKPADSPPKYQFAVEEATDSPTARDNPREKEGDSPASGLKEDAKDYGLLVKKPPVDRLAQSKALHFQLSPIVSFKVAATLLRPVIHPYRPLGYQPKDMVSLIIPKSLVPERFRMGPMRIPTEKYQGMLDIDDDELDDGLFDVDSLEVYDLEDDDKKRLHHLQSSSVADNSPIPPSPRHLHQGNLFKNSTSSIADHKSHRYIREADAPISLAHQVNSEDLHKEAAKVGTLVLEQGAPNSPSQPHLIPPVATADTSPRRAFVDTKTRKIEFVPENIKQYTKKYTKKPGQEMAKGVVTESLGPSLASTILRKIGQSGLTIDKISTTKNTRFFVLPAIAAVLIMQACLWTFYSLIFVYLADITSQFNTARQFLFLNFHPVLACYSTGLLQTQWILKEFGIERVDRYDNIQSQINDYDPVDPYFDSFAEFYDAYNIHKNFTAPVDNRFIPALTKYKYTDSMPLSSNGSERIETNYDNYKWQLAMIQNFRMIEKQLKGGNFNGTFYYEVDKMLDQVTSQVSEKTNTEIIVQQAIGFDETRLQIFWYCMICVFGYSGAMAIIISSIHQYRAKLIWIYKTYRAIDMKSLAKKMDQVEQLQESMAKGGKDSVCLSNTYFMNLMLKSATNDLASTFKKSGVFQTGHKAKSRLMNPVLDFLPKKSGNIVHKATNIRFMKSEAIEKTGQHETGAADKPETPRSSVGSKKFIANGLGTKSSQDKGIKMSHLERIAKSSENKNGRMTVKRIKSLSFFEWFNTGLPYVLFVLVFFYTVIIFMVNQFSTDQAKERVGRIYVESQAMIGVKFFTLRSVQAIFDTIMRTISSKLSTRSAQLATDISTVLMMKFGKA